MRLVRDLAIAVTVVAVVVVGFLMAGAIR